MKKSIREVAIALSIIPAMFSLMVLGTSESRAEGGIGSGPTLAQELVGTWELVSLDDVRPDGAKVPLYGPTPAGILFFDSYGKYALQVCAVGGAKTDSTKGVPAVANGCDSHWGVYTVDRKSKSVVLKIQHATIVSWEGTEQKRVYKMAKTLEIAVPKDAVGGTNPVAVWKHAR